MKKLSVIIPLVFLVILGMASVASAQYYPPFDRVITWVADDGTSLEIWDGETRSERPYLTIVEAHGLDLWVGVISDMYGTAEDDTLAASPTWREFKISDGESEAIPGLVRYLYSSGNAAWAADDTVRVKVYKK